MILHGYGCSWTQGVGADSVIESNLTNADLNKFRNEHSWLKLLANKLGLVHHNNGIAGNANNKIFNQIVSDIQYKKIKENDLVVIMWSSSLRDYVPFLPKGEWVSWSVKHLIETPEKFVNSFKSDDSVYTKFLMDYKNFFVTELFNQNYYNIVNQNYIVFLQKLLNYYGIKYIMCDSFEPMLIDLDKKDDVTHTIDKSTYWGFRKETFRDFLNKTNRLDIWEHQDTIYSTRATQHPNKEGYKLISEELYNYIVKNNII
jgi:hypothetical protein